MADFSTYSAWTPKDIFKTGTEHTCPLMQDACSDLVTKCQDSALQNKQLSLWQDAQTHKSVVTLGSRLLFRTTFGKQFFLPSVPRCISLTSREQSTLVPPSLERALLDLPYHGRFKIWVFETQQFLMVHQKYPEFNFARFFSTTL